MSNTTLPQSVRARIVEIERDHADVNLSTLNHYWKHEGLAYEDACHAEALEREVDRLRALHSAVGLSDQEWHELHLAEEELDRFVRMAKCHARKRRLAA